VSTVIDQKTKSDSENQINGKSQVQQHGTKFTFSFTCIKQGKKDKNIVTLHEALNWIPLRFQNVV